MQELKEQILLDGAHYEQSPMYHCLLLDRLLDCYNVASRNLKFKGQEKEVLFFQEVASRMLGHLESILYQDKTFPLFNDSAYDVAPIPQELFHYAQRLNVVWKSIPLQESGYRKMVGLAMELFLDVGNVTATYQPGHTHADTFTYELRIHGKPFIVDTGISTYDKDKRRQWERGTAAHNTVVIAHQNSSEVWSGFRLGHRAKVTLLKDSSKTIEALHDGFGKWGKHIRRFQLGENQLYIKDEISKEAPAQNYIHLAPDIQVISFSHNQIVTNVATLRIEGAEYIVMEKEWVASQYHRLKEHIVIRIHFRKKMGYRICIA